MGPFLEHFCPTFGATLGECSAEKDGVEKLFLCLRNAWRLPGAVLEAFLGVVGLMFQITIKNKTKRMVPITCVFVI